jgi:hypothetical protein
MKTLTALVLLAVAWAPVAAGAQATDLSGQWNATFTLTTPERTQSINFVFNFTHKGKALTGTIGPTTDDRRWPVEKGVVDGTKVTFQVQQPNGPLRSFKLALVKGRLQGNQTLEFQGQTAEVTVDAERAK